ncbi:MAG: hypothetical protein ACOZIN_15790 [Myxococcota bacterium]
MNAFALIRATSQPESGVLDETSNALTSVVRQLFKVIAGRPFTDAPLDIDGFEEESPDFAALLRGLQARTGRPIHVAELRTLVVHIRGLVHAESTASLTNSWTNRCAEENAAAIQDSLDELNLFHSLLKLTHSAPAQATR